MAIQIRQQALLSWNAEEIRLLTDPYDRVVVLDPHCWTRQGHTEKDMARLTSEQEDGRTAQLHLSEPMLSNWKTGAVRIGRAQQPGVWHLTADTDKILDAIDLKNGGKDVLILRNDGRLRRGVNTVIVGDPDLDEVWLDGSAGWILEYQDRGVTARVPHQSDENTAVLQFGPGLKIRQLPMPDFLRNPALLDQPHYPGSKNQITKAGTVLVTRGGYVGFSSEQFAHRKVVDLTNGRQNILRLNKMDLILANEELEIRGDPDLDILIATGMPKPTITKDGTYTWVLDGPPWQRTIVAKALKVIR